MGKFNASRTPKKYTNIHIIVAIKLVDTTNKKKCVPPKYAGDPNAKHMIANNWNKNKKIFKYVYLLISYNKIIKLKEDLL